jgi:hypothetical protein
MKKNYLNQYIFIRSGILKAAKITFISGMIFLLTGIVLAIIHQPVSAISPDPIATNTVTQVITAQTTPGVVRPSCLCATKTVCVTPTRLTRSQTPIIIINTPTLASVTPSVTPPEYRLPTETVTEIAASATPTLTSQPTATEVVASVTPSETSSPTSTEIAASVTPTLTSQPTTTKVAASVTPSETSSPTMTKIVSRVTPTLTSQPTITKVLASVTPSEYRLHTPTGIAASVTPTLTSQRTATKVVASSTSKITITTVMTPVASLSPVNELEPLLPPSSPTGSSTLVFLLPVTGADYSNNSSIAADAFERLLMNLGIGLIGMCLVLKGVANEIGRK